MNEIIAQIIAALYETGPWRGSLNRADIAELRLKGYQVYMMSDGPDAAGLFDVEVS